MRSCFNLRHVLCLLAITTILLSFAETQPLTAQQTTPPVQASQFDFWVGDWNLTWETAQGVTQNGNNKVSKILNGRVIEERFDGGDALPLKGVSHSVFDMASGKWKQTWVDNNGSYLDFAGEFADGKMTLGRETTGSDGKTIKQRMVFYNIQDDSIDWNWESSVDDGTTWKLQWKIRYERK